MSYNSRHTINTKTNLFHLFISNTIARFSGTKMIQSNEKEEGRIRAKKNLQRFMLNVFEKVAYKLDVSAHKLQNKLHRFGCHMRDALWIHVVQASIHPLRRPMILRCSNVQCSYGHPRREKKEVQPNRLSLTFRKKSHTQ